MHSPLPRGLLVPCSSWAARTRAPPPRPGNTPVTTVRSLAQRLLRQLWCAHRVISISKTPPTASPAQVDCACWYTCWPIIATPSPLLITMFTHRTTAGQGEEEQQDCVPEHPHSSIASLYAVTGADRQHPRSTLSRAGRPTHSTRGAVNPSCPALPARLLELPIYIPEPDAGSAPPLCGGAPSPAALSRRLLFSKEHTRPLHACARDAAAAQTARISSKIHACASMRAP